MRKYFFLFFIAATAYLAAVFRSPSLMALAVAEVLFFALMGICALYLRTRVRVRTMKEGYAFRKQPSFIRLFAENKSRIPVRRVKMRLICGAERDENEEKPQEEELSFVLPYGEKTTGLEILPEHCGFYHFAVKKMRISEPAGFFFPRIRKTEESRVAVLPMSFSMPLPFAGDPARERNLYLQKAEGAGSDYEEVRDIRELRSGDPVRYVHWKLSAKEDRLMIREFEKEEEHYFILHAEADGIETIDADTFDAFAEILMAVIRGVNEAGWKLVLFLTLKKGQKAETDVYRAQIREEGDAEAFFTNLYSLREGEGTSLAEAEFTEEFPKEQMVRFGTDLILSVPGGMSFAFSKEHYEEELARQSFII